MWTESDRVRYILREENISILLQQCNVYSLLPTVSFLQGLYAASKWVVHLGYHGLMDLKTLWLLTCAQQQPFWPAANVMHYASRVLIALCMAGMCLLNTAIGKMGCVVASSNTVQATSIDKYVL